MTSCVTLGKRLSFFLDLCKSSHALSILYLGMQILHTPLCTDEHAIIGAHFQFFPPPIGSFQLSIISETSHFAEKSGLHMVFILSRFLPLLGIWCCHPTNTNVTLVSEPPAFPAIFKFFTFWVLTSHVSIQQFQHAVSPSPCHSVRPLYDVQPCSHVPALSNERFSRVKNPSNS